MQKIKKAWTIKTFIIFFMIFIIILQALFFALVLTLGGSLRNITNNTFQPFKDTAELRVADFEKQLNEAADVLAINSTAINENLEAVAAKYKKPISELSDNQSAKMEMYLSNVDILRNMAVKDNVSGVFLILDTRTELDRYKITPISAVFLRKSDQATENATSPTTLLIGGDYLTEGEVTHKSIYWTECLQMTDLSDYDFYLKTLEIAEKYQNIPSENLGYWSHVYELNDSGHETVAYTLPIRDSENKVVGVMGLELELSYLQLLLPYYELNSQGQGDYLVTAVKNTNDSTGERVFNSGVTFNSINNYSSEIEYSEKANTEGLYTIVPKGKNHSKVYCTKNEIKINENAQYNYTPWILSGVVESRYLLAYIDKLKMNIFIAFLLTMIITLVVVLKFAGYVAKPINSFVETIRSIRPDNLVHPEPTKIVEFNELGESISDLTEEIAKFSKKTSAIISMTGISISAFEFDPNSNLVFCTEDTFKLFGITHQDSDALYMQKSVFTNKIAPILKEIKADIDMTAPIKNGDETKWLHVKTVQSGEKILGTIRDVTAETLEKQKINYERDHDSLTALLQRQPFIDRLRKKYARKAPNYALLAVCKIPDLTMLNNRYGSLVGDKYIKSLSEVFFSADRSKTLVSRTMGDEFTITIEGRTVDEILTIFNGLLDKLNNTFFEYDSLTLPHNIFAGAAWYPTHTRDIEQLIAYAEFAAQSVDRFSGRNLVQVFSPEDYQMSVEKHMNQEKIGDMLERGDISYAYQPIIDTSTGDIYGYEALMRPDSSLGITPGDVMSYAAQHNAFYAVERTTWLNALKSFSQQVDCLSPKKIFINSIPNQLLNEEDIESLESQFGDYLDNVVLEILENEQTDEDFINKKRALKEKWHCLLALDDFGSGYANENSLLTIKPDLIKLDLDLVANIDEDADRQSLVKNIVGYAHNRNIKVLAEGIETREQMNILLSLRVDLLQGFYLAKPNKEVLPALSEKIKTEITTFDPNDMFSANVALRM